MGFCAVGSGEHQDVVVVDLLLLVGKLEELLVDIVQGLFAELDPEGLEPELEGGVTASRREDDRVGVDSHVDRVDDFVGFRILEHSVLVDAGRVGEGILSDDGLVRLDRHIHQA